MNIYDMEIPMGLGAALVMNQDAMDYYLRLPQEEKQRIIDYTHQISSKEEMRTYVESLISI